MVFHVMGRIEHMNDNEGKLTEIYVFFISNDPWHSDAKAPPSPHAVVGATKS